MRFPCRSVVLTIIAVLSPMASAAQTVEGRDLGLGVLLPSLDAAAGWSDSSRSEIWAPSLGDPPPPSANGWVLFGTTMVVVTSVGYLAGSIGENLGVDKDRMMIFSVALGVLSTVMFCVRAECRW